MLRGEIMSKYVNLTGRRRNLHPWAWPKLKALPIELITRFSHYKDQPPSKDVALSEMLVSRQKRLNLKKHLDPLMDYYHDLLIDHPATSLYTATNIKIDTLPAGLFVGVIM